MTHPKELPLASPELQTKCMQEASEFVTKMTSIAKDCAFIAGSKIKDHQELVLVIELVLYMSIFSVAEKAANADGFTLEDWDKHAAAYEKLQPVMIQSNTIN